MKKSIIAAVFAAAGLIAAASGNAFAGLQATGGYDLPDSFARTFTANGGGNFDVLPSFNRFEVTRLGATSFTVNNETFLISNPQALEDVASHDAITSFSVAGWAQTNPAPATTPGTVNFAAAAGTTINSGLPGLGFALNFGTGEATDGMHVRIDFFQDNVYRTSYTVKFKQTNIQGNTAIFGTEIVNSVIPLPPAVWSGLAMMAGLGVFLAKRRNDRKILS